MRIVIVGDGKVGKSLTEQLSSEGHDIVVIDSNPNVISNVVNTHDVMGICGNGASYEVQREAEVNKADMLIAATSADELNILCCLVAKKIGAKHTIARVRNPEYSRQLAFMREELGLSMTINPELAAANEISRMLRFPSALKVDFFARGRVDLVELKVHAGGSLENQTLSSLSKKYQSKALICAVQRGEEVHIPSGDFILRAGDKIYVTGSQVEIEKFFRAIGVLKQKVRKVMIVGGGRIAHYLARQLSETGMKVKIIEIDRNRCIELSDALPKAEIINGDGSDKDVLLEEGIAETDAFIALTGIDEENIIVSVYATLLGINKVIAKINRGSFSDILTTIGLDSLISPKQITTNQIIRYVRAMQNSTGDGVVALSRIVDGKAEAVEFTASPATKFTGIQLKDITLRPNILIACIFRRNRIIIPGGADSIENGDSVIIVTTDRTLRDLNDILA